MHSITGRSKDAKHAPLQSPKILQIISHPASAPQPRDRRGVQVLPAPRSAISQTPATATAQSRTDEVEGHEVCLPAHAPEHAADAAQDAIWELVQRRNGADCCHHVYHLHIIHEQVACRKHNSSSGRQHWRVSFRRQTPPSPSHPAVWLEQYMGRMSGHSTSMMQHRQTNVAAHQGCRGTPRCRDRQLSGSPFLQPHHIMHDMSAPNAKLHTCD